MSILFYSSSLLYFIVLMLTYIPKIIKKETMNSGCSTDLILPRRCIMIKKDLPTGPGYMNEYMEYGEPNGEIDHRFSSARSQMFRAYRTTAAFGGE
ncbi:unnamed protein product, partial [Vitis vinifera]|uniref:Uncharacterized protein n=1 Tax=Vitis vinifera TaxID=29760 RepID=D7T9R9_VITVI